MQKERGRNYFYMSFVDLSFFEVPMGKELMALHREGDQLLFMALSQEGASFKLESCFSCSIQSPDELSTFWTLCRDYASSHSEALWLFASSAEHILFRRLELHVPLHQAKKHLPFQLEALVPFDWDELVFDAYIQKEGKKKEAFAFLMQASFLQKDLDWLAEQSIVPDIVSCPQIALCHFSHALLEGEEPRLLLHSTEDSLLLCIIEKGLLLASSCLTAAYVKALKKDFSCSSFEREWDRHLEDLRLGASIENLSSIDYCLTGSSASHSSLQSLCSERFGKSLSPRGDLDESIDWQKQAISLGLACSALPQSGPFVCNFLQGPLESKNPWRYLRKAALRTGLLALSVFLSLLLILSLHLQKKEEELLEACEYIFSRSERSFPTRNTVAQLCAELPMIRQDLRKRLPAFSLLPNVPGPKESFLFLDKLSTSISTNEKPGKILKLHYKLLQYPSLLNKKKSYKARLDFHFESSPRWARDLHDLLIQDRGFIDQKAKLSWKKVDNTYHVTFFLKTSSSRRSHA